MGRHEAEDGAATHPLVAQALGRQASEDSGAHRGELPGTEGPVGWPGPEPDEQGNPLGWPGRPVPESPSPADEREPAASPEPRGWRRLFGRSRAA
jgi:hypothetical protein